MSDRSLSRLAVPPTPSTPSARPRPPRGLVRLCGAVECLPWGPLGDVALVGRLARAGNSIEKVEATARYAELWIGTKPGVRIFGANQAPIAQSLHDFPGLVSASAPEDVGMSFMLKVLSVGRSTAIDLRPPRLMCALTDCELLAGFESVGTIVARLPSLSEMCEIIEHEPDGREGIQSLVASVNSPFAQQQKALQGLVHRLLSASPSLVASKINAMRARIGTSSEALDQLALRLNFDHLHDVGVLFAYLLCHRRLTPGQTVFIDVNEPHVLVSGNFIEVCSSSPSTTSISLALSDSSVVNKSTELRATSSSYSSAPLVGEAKDEYTEVFSPPEHALVDADFLLERLVLPPDSHHHHLLAPSSYSALVFVLEGCGEARWNDGQSRVPLGRGMVFFQPAMTNVKILGQVTLFRAVKKGHYIKVEQERKYEMYREERKKLSAPVSVITPAPAIVGGVLLEGSPRVI